MVSDVAFTELDVADETAENYNSKENQTLNNDNKKDDNEDNNDDDDDDSEIFYDDEEEFYDKHLADGQIHIMDVENYTLGHMTNMSLSLTRTYMKYLQEAYPLRLKALHVINCPAYFNRMLAITRPFIRDDVFQMVMGHRM